MSEAADLFLELTAIPSPPGEERGVADAVLRYLRALGLDADEDACGPRIGSTAGNVYARVEPTADGTPLFLQEGTGFANLYQGPFGKEEVHNLFVPCCGYAGTLAVDSACGACSSRTCRTPGSSSSSRRWRRSV